MTIGNYNWLLENGATHKFKDQRKSWPILNILITWMCPEIMQSKLGWEDFSSSIYDESEETFAKLHAKLHSAVSRL